MVIVPCEFFIFQFIQPETYKINREELNGQNTFKTYLVVN